MRKFILALLVLFTPVSSALPTTPEEIHEYFRQGKVVPAATIEKYYAENKEAIEGRINQILTRYNYNRQRYFLQLEKAVFDIVCERCDTHFTLCRNILTVQEIEAFILLMFEGLYGTIIII